MGRDTEPGTVYEFVVKGGLDDRFAFHFEGMRLERRDGTTALIGRLVDQPQVAGVMAQIQELGLELISVRQLEKGDQAAGPASPRIG